MDVCPFLCLPMCMILQPIRSKLHLRVRFRSCRKKEQFEQTLQKKPFEQVHLAGILRVTNGLEIRWFGMALKNGKSAHFVQNGSLEICLRSVFPEVS